jgi:hypothetical protein
MMDTKDTLLVYSEWLDGKGLLVPGPESHSELIAEFIAEWEARPGTAALADAGDFTASEAAILAHKASSQFALHGEGPAF